MNRINLTEDNYIGIAMKYYDNIQCNTIEEFQNDIYRIVCVKKLIDKYLSSGKINLRLVLNHVIILHNSFDVLSIDLLRLRLEEKHLPVIKSILVYLKYIESDYWNDVIEDAHIFNELRRI
jgi:hypothetical protein